MGTYILGGVLFLALGAIYFLFQKTQGLEKKLTKVLLQNASNNSFTKNEVVQLVNETIAEKTMAKEDLESLIESLRHRPEPRPDLSEETTTEDPPFTDGTIENVVAKEETPEPVLEEVSRHLFATLPNELGYFSGRKLSDNLKPRETFYKIILEEEGSGKAHYTLVDDRDTLEFAFNIPDSYILPACRLNGDGLPDDVLGMKVTPGELIKENNNWKITRKLEITF